MTERKIDEAIENLTTLKERYKHYLVEETLALLADIQKEQAEKNKQLSTLAAQLKNANIVIRSNSETNQKQISALKISLANSDKENDELIAENNKLTKIIEQDTDESTKSNFEIGELRLQLAEKDGLIEKLVKIAEHDKDCMVELQGMSSGSKYETFAKMVTSIDKVLLAAVEQKEKK